MPPTSHRGEISLIHSHITNQLELFISYGIRLPTAPAQPIASGCYEIQQTNPMLPIYTSFFTIERRSPGSIGVTRLEDMEKSSPNLIAKVEWSNPLKEDVYLGLISGYELPISLPNNQSQITPPSPAPPDVARYQPCHLSVAMDSMPGIGVKGGHGGFHARRQQTLQGAILTIYLPQGVANTTLELFRFSHISNLWQPAADTNTVQRLTQPEDRFVVGDGHQNLALGFFVVALAVEQTPQNDTPPASTVPAATNTTNGAATGSSPSKPKQKKRSSNTA